MYILVVDDEPMIRSLAQRVLEPAGHRVFEADSEFAALEIAGELGSHLDLALIDYRLDGYTCDDLIHMLWQINSSISVVISSGDENAMNKLPEEIGRRATALTKPYTANELLECVENVEPQDSRE